MVEQSAADCDLIAGLVTHPQTKREREGKNESMSSTQRVCGRLREAHEANVFGEQLEESVDGQGIYFWRSAAMHALDDSLGIASCKLLQRHNRQNLRRSEKVDRWKEL